MKIYGHASANGDFPCAKLQNGKKNRQNILLPIMNKPGMYIDEQL